MELKFIITNIFLNYTIPLTLITNLLKKEQKKIINSPKYQ